MFTINISESLTGLIHKSIVENNIINNKSICHVYLPHIFITIKGKRNRFLEHLFPVPPVYMKTEEKAKRVEKLKTKEFLQSPYAQKGGCMK